MPTYKLTYFQGRGNAECARITFAAAGVEFEDERLPKEEWLKRKPDAPMKAMPLLTVTQDGKDTTYCQTHAIAKYIGRKHGLVGSTPEEQCLVDEVLDSYMDTMSALMKAYSEKDDKKKAELMEEFKKESLPKFVGYITSRQKQFGSNGYLIGHKLSIADIRLYTFVEMTSSHGMGDAWKSYSAIMTHFDKIKAEPRIAEWIAKRPESTF